VNYRFLKSIADISPIVWNAVTGTDYPFLRHEFLLALEVSDSVGVNRGWQPSHLIVEDNKNVLAVLPLYIKTHSYGEYVFDWSWADAYHREGLEYYPKLLAAIPFTPAAGTRLATVLDDVSVLQPLLHRALDEKVKMLGASGWHTLFPQQQELSLWKIDDACLRLGCQFHWYNKSYTHFDNFLATFTSRKRKDVKKERRLIAEQGIQVQRFVGNDITVEHWQIFYYFYQITYAKKSGHGGYLTPEFFLHLHSSMPEQLLLVMAYKDDKPIAAALNLFSSDTLYGRYWGASEDIAGLHFEVCYYQGIEFCIEKNLRRFDAGAQGEHKIQRGFEPTITYSFHKLAHQGFHRAIKSFVQQETIDIKSYACDVALLLPFKQSN
jgi:hypothetical protein